MSHKLNIDGMYDIFKECVKLGEEKSRAYSNKVDVISITGVEGISIRLVDKVLRMHSLVSQNKTTSGDESMIDTLQDIINYSTYGILLLQNKWSINENINSKVKI